MQLITPPAVIMQSITDPKVVPALVLGQLLVDAPG
jgi:hypothetical protein